MVLLWANRYLTPFNFFDSIRKSKFTNCVCYLLGLNNNSGLPKFMTKELIFMIENFPSQRTKIIELYNRDPDFKQLCNDYCLSVKMLEAFKKTEPDIKKVKRDYELVSKELESELERFLNKRQL